MQCCCFAHPCASDELSSSLDAIGTLRVDLHLTLYPNDNQGHCSAAWMCSRASWSVTRAHACVCPTCRPGGARCHEGPVEVLMHDRQTNYLLSGGGDGCLRLWEAARVQEAEPPEGSNTVEVKPAVTVALPECSISSGSSSCGSSSSGGSSSGGRACGVRGLVWLDRRTWLVQSEAGALVKVRAPHRAARLQAAAAAAAAAAVLLVWRG